MTQLETQLHRSIIYRKLLNDMESLVVGDWSESEKLKMLWLLDDTVGQVVRETVEGFTLRCAECDAPIDPICEECA